MASGRNFVFYAKEQVCLVICVGNRRFGIKDVEWGRKCLNDLDLKNFEF